MKSYDPKKIEIKWQKEWEKKKIYQASDKSIKPKFYGLMEFPYPSGDGLHTGHVRGYTAMDIISRKRRMEGHNVLYPIGWDAFGLPTENYAIKTGKQPALITKNNTDIFRKQFKGLGISFDWSREVNTTDPKYYKWTQWLFLQFLKKDLAYKAKININWCPKDKTGLANEEVVNGMCERCGTPVEKREKEQWMLAITKYADRLDKDLDTVDYLPQIKLQQRNWIGRSEGAEIDFLISEEIDKPNYIILHGRNGSPNSYTVPWLKNSLEAKGFKVQVPFLPNPSEPNDDEQTNFVLKNCKIDNNTIIIGYSFGGIVALRLLEKGVRLKKVFLLCTPYSGKFLDNQKRLSITQACKKGFDFKKIIQGAESFGLIYDTTDHIVPMSDGETFAQKLNAQLVKIKCQRPHLSGEQEPLALESLIPSIKVLIGTRNEAKIKMMKECLPDILGVEFISLNDIPAIDDSSLIEGDDFEKNARMKAEFYFKKTGIPTISTDNVFWVEKWPKNNGIMLHMRKEANPKSERATDKEVILFWQNWLKKVGGQSKAHFMYAIAFANTSGTKSFSSTQRDYLLQKNESKEFWEGYPTESLLLDVKTKEYKSHQKNEVRYDQLIIDLERYSKEWFKSSLDIHRSDLWNIKVFTTRPDTIFGATYLVLSPEHPLLVSRTVLDTLDNKEEVRRYIEAVKNKTEIERTAEGKEKTGVELKGVKATNPATKEEIPVWIADYVLPHYGTGAIMAVPADDTRDEEFASKFNLPIVRDYPKAGFEDFGKKVIKFKLRDWVFSRQRYWGEPIPVIHCESCGVVPVPDKDLPVVLPKIKNYYPTDSGESPLAKVSSWVNVKCPKCKGKAKRETDTMPNWAGSSWYFLRYIDHKNNKTFADMKKLKYWMPVDWYNGGNEHTTLHLLYSRFWNKFLFDLGLVPTSEPYMKRTSHGMILAPGGEKMSKSRGNVINPNTIINTYGADTLRLYEMFMGPFDQAIAWSEEAIVGPRRFLEKVWKIGQSLRRVSSGEHGYFSTEKFLVLAPSRSQVSLEDTRLRSATLTKILHKTIKKVSEDIESMRFNTAISAMMILATEMDKFQGQTLNPQKGLTLSLEDYKKFLQILAPFAPHMTDELWNMLGEESRVSKDGTRHDFAKSSIHTSSWPKWDEQLLQDDEVKIAVQINGKVRGEIMIGNNDGEEEVKKKALENQAILKYTKDQNIKKTIYVKNRLINIIL